MSDASQAFGQLHPGLQKWIVRQRWDTLRPTQEQAISPILAGDRDVIVAAATAGGKTEAAFLPILSRLAADRDSDESLGLALYIAPLKALINDQYRRLELMAEELEVQTVPWHGDITQLKKKRFLESPTGVLLITPESLEAILMRHGQKAQWLFAKLRYVVIDEMHAFIGDERGMQLQSLMHRIELAIGHRVPRIGLSATLGDMAMACDFLRPGHGQAVQTIVSSDDAGGLKLQIRGYRAVPPALSRKEAEAREAGGAEVPVEDLMDGDVLDIGQHLYYTLRGSNNLIFANSRKNVEMYADLLRRACERDKVPVEFFPHHGSLDKGLRSDVEDALKNQSRPMSAVCTSTLEMGIDIGAVASIAQIGAPYEVSSMRQRLGRSGRRGEPAVMRIYIRENGIDPRTLPPDRLRPELCQAVAMTQLLLDRWIEPPRAGALHLSTLIQQVLSVIVQHGGATAQSLWNVLGENAPFAIVGRQRFIKLLHRMGETKLLMQAADGLLLPGDIGEKLANHYSFYAAFSSPEEYVLGVSGKIIGRLPIDRPVAEGSLIIFAGRRWRVLRVDSEHKRIDLARATGGVPPTFGGSAGVIADEIRAEMFDLLNGAKPPIYLNKLARELFEEGQYHFRDLRLAARSILDEGNHTLLFPWSGDTASDTLAALMTHHGIEAHSEGICLHIPDSKPDEVINALRRIDKEPPPTPETLAAAILNKADQKHSEWLGEELLCEDWASRRLDIAAGKRLARQLTAQN
jgi:ATP-dependent Lhr-like helicase